MRKHLGQKVHPRKIRAVLRHATLDHGWTPIPCENKEDMMGGWTTWKVTHERIDGWAGGWDFAGTGIRLDDPEIFVVDVDISDPEIFAEVMAALRGRWPEFFANAIERSSGAVKRAFFGRISEPYVQLRTLRYTAERELLKEISNPDLTKEERKAITGALNGQHLETFGGLSNGRYFAFDGPHSPGREYSCIGGRSPATVDFKDLPMFAYEELGELVNMVDALLAARLEPILTSRQQPAGVFYDLEPGMAYITRDGEEIELTELEAQLDKGATHGVRGCMDWVAYNFSDSKANCNAFVGDQGRLIIQSFQDDRQHRWADSKPEPAFELPEETMAVLRALAESMGEPEPDTHAISERRARPLDDVLIDDDRKATHERAVLWLHEEMAHCAKAVKSGPAAYSIFPGGEHHREPIPIAALRSDLLPWSYMQRGPKGGKPKRVHPLDTWLASPRRIRVGGTRLRPELPRPLFREDGQTFINLYAPPCHPAVGGSVEVFMTFFRKFIPDDAERAWVWNWHATKVRFPWQRMVVPVHVAQNTEGTGRGLFIQVMAKVFGAQYVVPIPFSKISGGAGSQFRAEVVDKLMVFVNEAKTSNSARFHGRNEANEALKDFCEPDHEGLVYIEPKHVNGYHTRLAISTQIFSNNLDGIPVNDGSRRYAPVSNGEMMTAEEVERLRAWAAVPANIGALYRALRDHAIEQDKAVFNAYQAPHFRTHDLMVDASTMALDAAWDAATEKLKSAADLATMTQITAVTRHYLGSSFAPDIDALIEKHTKVSGHRVGVKHKQNWLVRFGEARDNRERVYAFDAVSARQWTTAGPAEIKAELYKAQAVVDAPAKAFNKLMKGVKKP